MKDKNLWIFAIVFFFLIYIVNTYTKSPNFPHINSISDGYIYSNNNRELVIEDSPKNIYEYNVIKYISSNISGEFKNVYDEVLLDTSDRISISNSKKQYEKGYGAKNIVIHEIDTYESLDDLKKDESDIYRLENLSSQNKSFDVNKIIHVLYDYQYTDKSIGEDAITFRDGMQSQYYILNKTNEKIIFTEFLGN